MIGLNAVQPPQLNNPFAPANGMTLQQQAQQGNGYTPAQANPFALASDGVPDAASALANLRSQQAGQQQSEGWGAHAGGVTPNSATPPAAAAPTSTGAPPPTPGAPPTWQDLLHSLSRGQVPGMGNPMGGFASLGQNLSNGFSNGLGGLFAHLGIGQPPAGMPGQAAPPMAPPPPMMATAPASGGVLGSLRPPLPAGGGILSY